MSRMTPVAFVIDRHTDATAAEQMLVLGGSWVTSFQTWQRSPTEFLVMLAHTDERLRLGAPLVFFARDVEALRKAMVAACSQLTNTRCAWILLMREETEGIRVVRDELLIDAVAGGAA